MPRRYAGVGSCKIPSTRQVGYASVYGNTFCCLACLSLLLTMPTRVLLLFPPCGHTPLLTLHGRLNLHRCLQRRRFPVPRSNKRPNVALYAVDPLFLLPTPPSQCTLVGNTGTCLCCVLFLICNKLLFEIQSPLRVAQELDTSELQTRRKSIQDIVTGNYTYRIFHQSRD